MAFANVNIGLAPQDGTGDPLRVAFDKINRNFTSIQNGTAGVTVNAPVLSVAGRTGNIRLTINDIAGLGAAVGSTISSAAVVNGNLIISLTNSNTLNAGYVVGPQGIQGVQGVQGTQGIQGVQGIQGNTGPQGIQGNVGPAGETGPQGIQGNVGPQGPQGIQGNVGPQGIQGVKGDQGVSVTLVGNVDVPSHLPVTGNAGEAYIVTSTGNLYFWNTQVSSWADIGPIVGPRGEQGPQGIQGNVGPQGIQGNVGPQGPQGIQGIQGNVGPQGPQGIQGNVGPQGIQGIQGNVGPQGPQGIQGNIGPQGDPGPGANQDLNTYNDVTFANVATNNLNFGQKAIGAPAPFGATDRITLFDFDGANTLSGNYNYAIGVEPDHIWFANDYASDNGGFKFYGRGNLAAKIGSAGTITLGENSTGIFWSNGVSALGNTTSLTGWSIDPLLNNSLVPITDNLQDIGTPTNRVRHIYVGPGSVTVGNAVITESSTGSLVIPGLTRGTGYTVEDVEDTGDQTYSFGGAPTVIDNAYFAILNGIATAPGGYTAPEYSVDQLDGEGFIDGISVTSSGSGLTQAEADLMRQGMWAYVGSDPDPIGNFVGSDWTQIPFRARAKAGSTEYEFNTGGGANTGDIIFDGSVVSTERGNTFRIESTTENADQNAIEFNNTNLDLYAYNDETGSYSEIKLENVDNNSPWILLNVKSAELGSEARWAFNGLGDLTFPDGTVQTTAYTGGAGGGGVTGLVGEYSTDSQQEGDLQYTLTTNYNSDSEVKLRVYKGASSGHPGIVLGANGNSTRMSDVVAIGNDDVGYNSKQGGVYIGREAGWNNIESPQGEFAIAIGYKAARNFAEDSSITLNATGLELNPTGAGLFVKPIRENTNNTTKAIFYDTATGELTYADAVSGGGGNANTGNITFDGTTISTDGTEPGYPTLVNSPNSLGGVEIDYDSETVSHAMWLNGEDGLAIQINRHLDPGESYWAFSPDGALTFPDGTKQTTAYTGGSVTGLDIDGGSASTETNELEVDGGGA